MKSELKYSQPSIEGIFGWLVCIRRPGVLGSHRKNWGDHPHTSAAIPSVEKWCRKVIEPKLEDIQCGIRPGPTTTEQIFYSEFSRYLRSMPKTSTQIVSTLRKYTTGFIGKSLRECSGSTVLTAACYCLLAVWSLYFRSEIVYVSVESNHNRAPWELHSDNGVRGHHSYTLCELYTS